MEDAPDIAREIVILIKYSPKREGVLGDIKDNLEMEDHEYEQPAGVTKLSKTRSTIRAICFQRILSNYNKIMGLWCATLKQGKLDSEVKHGQKYETVSLLFTYSKALFEYRRI